MINPQKLQYRTTRGGFDVVPGLQAYNAEERRWRGFNLSIRLGRVSTDPGRVRGDKFEPRPPR